MKEYLVYLRHILDAIEKIESYTAVGKETFMITAHWQDATIRNLEIIGEAVKRLSAHSNIATLKYHGEMWQAFVTS